MTSDLKQALTYANRIAFERAFRAKYPDQDMSFDPSNGYIFPNVHHVSIGWQMHADEPTTSDAIALWELEPDGWEAIDGVAELLTALPVGTRLFYLPDGAQAPREVVLRARDMEIAHAVQRACAACTDAGGIADDVRKDIGELNLSSIIASVGASDPKLSHQENATQEERQGYESPFSLTVLQSYATKIFGMPAARVHHACMSLYETHRLISYPRSDCCFLPENQHAEAAQILRVVGENNPGLDRAIARVDPAVKSPAWNDARVTHCHAIIPTATRFPLSRLSEDERQIYEMICRQYVAQFYPVGAAGSYTPPILPTRARLTVLNNKIERTAP